MRRRSRPRAPRSSRSRCAGSTSPTPSQPMLTDFIDPKKVTYLPNTAGCFTAEDAIRTLRLAREAGGWNLVKLEVLGEAQDALPRHARDAAARPKSWSRRASSRWSIASTIRSPRSSSRKPARSAVMPLGAPIGSGLGIQNRVTIRLIVEGAERAGAGRRRRRHRERRGGRDGARLRRRADEHRDRRGARTRC